MELDIDPYHKIRTVNINRRLQEDHSKTNRLMLVQDPSLEGVMGIGGEALGDPLALSSNPLVKAVKFLGELPERFFN